MNRRLTLKAEHLTELSPADLSAVAGGTVSDLFTGYYPSLNAPCTTLLRPVTPILPPTG